jgi:hypothetical protein
LKAFVFEHSHRFTEKEYVQVTTVFSRKPRHRVRRATIVVVIAIACLFSRYTLIPGALLLLLTALGAWVPHTFHGTATRWFRDSKLLKHELTYGASERGLWVRGPDLSAWAAWHLLGHWRIRGDWLMLPCNGIPTVFLPVSELQAAGVFEQVMALVRTHGTAFDGEAEAYARSTVTAAA